jgi:predicted Kef-type K+ transport protein
MSIENPFYIDALWLCIAFAAGLLTKRIGLPPLIGFLAAGFLINFMGIQDGKLSNVIEGMSDIGVMLLLFTIGLKLKIKSLFRKEIGATASIHMILMIAFFSLLMAVLSFSGLTIFANIPFQTALILGFALSFSSTVFAVKVLEEQGEFTSFHGRLAIGILIVQDIFAVVFIAVSGGKLPSIYILLLPILLWAVRWLLRKFLDLLEHGEMVPVFGFFATFIAGALGFSLLGLKPDLGALIMGMLLANHNRSSELYERMVEYKDFFLIAFFMNIGLIGLPTWSILTAALLIVPFLALKGALFFWILTQFKLTARTSYLTSLSLSNYSEFGLIVGVVAFNNEMISEDWMVVLALVMSLSFLIAAPLNVHSHLIFDKLKKQLVRINPHCTEIDKEPMDFGDAQYLVVGLGSIGMHTFQSLTKKVNAPVAGLDYKKEIIELNAHLGDSVFWGDATDSELWDNADTSNLQAVFLTMTDFYSNLHTLQAIQRLEKRTFKIHVISHYPDQTEKYLNHGVDYVFDYKSNLGKDYVINALNLD